MTMEFVLTSAVTAFGGGFFTGYTLAVVKRFLEMAG